MSFPLEPKKLYKQTCSIFVTYKESFGREKIKKNKRKRGVAIGEFATSCHLLECYN